MFLQSGDSGGDDGVSGSGGGGIQVCEIVDWVTDCLLQIFFCLFVTLFTQWWHSWVKFWCCRRHFIAFFFFLFMSMWLTFTFVHMTVVVCLFTSVLLLLSIMSNCHSANCQCLEGAYKLQYQIDSCYDTLCSYRTIQSQR